MIAAHTSVEDAIHVYKLTLSYLYDARLGNRGMDQDFLAKEVVTGEYHIWRRLPRTIAERYSAPEAICTYQPDTKIWRVELSSGAKLNLLDTGKVWDILRKDDRRVRSGAKKLRKRI